MCLPPASPGTEQLHKPPNVEGQPMRSRDHSRTVIIDLDPLAKQFQVNSVAAPRPLAAAGQLARVQLGQS